MKSSNTADKPSPYVSPKELAARWCVSRSQIDVIARRAGFSRVCLGEGRNGAVRFLREETEAFEQSRTVKPT